MKTEALFEIIGKWGCNVSVRNNSWSASFIDPATGITHTVKSGADYDSNLVAMESWRCVAKKHGIKIWRFV